MSLISTLPSETTMTTNDFFVVNASVSGIETTIRIKASDMISALSLGGGGGGGAVIAVKQSQLTSVFTTTSNSFVDTGLSITYTPTSASNKIFLMISVQGSGTSGTTQIFGQLVRGSTPIALGDAASSRLPVTTSAYGTDSAELVAIYSMALNWLDSPATTSSTTWKYQISTQGIGTVYLNRTQADTNDATHPRTVSTLTLMECLP